MGEGAPRPRLTTWAAIIRDAQLTREARLMGAYLASLGAGTHEVSTEDWQRLLGPSRGGPPKRQTIAGWIAELELHGYVEKSPGGRGSPTYTVPQEDGRTYTVPQGDGRVFASTVPLEFSTVPLESLQSPRRTVEPHVVVVEEEVGVGEEDAREGRYGLEPVVMDIIDAPNDDGTPILEGCRGALLDYLRARVMGPGQVGYVRSLQAWLRGGSGTPRGLLDVDDPPHLLATALNDLMTEDETTYRSGRGQVGVVANLRAKVEHLARAEARPVRANGTSTPHRPALDIANQGRLD